MLHFNFICFTLMTCLFSGVSALHAQITLTSADMPQPGITYPLVNAAILDLSLGELSGEGVTWDASDLVPIADAPLTPLSMGEASVTAALVFNSPFNSAYQCDFFLPTEFPDLGVDLGIPLDGFNNFYQTDGNAYTIAGIGLSASWPEFPFTYDDKDEIIPLPLEYGSEMTSTAAFSLDLTGILSYGLVQERQVVVDGWGTLILPSGSYEVLRTRTDLTATDDVFIEQLGDPFTIDREQTTYQWWGVGTGFPLLEITEIIGLSVIGSYQDFTQNNGIPTGSLQAQHSAIYPNPASAGGEIQFGQTVSWSLFDTRGSEVISGQGSSVWLPGWITSGMYFVRTGNQTQPLIIR
jgi:hypothetical protein